MLTKVYKSRKILYTVAALLVIVLFFVYFTKLSDKGQDNDIIRLDEGWTLIFGDTTFKVSSLSRFKVFHDLRVGDSFVYIKKLDKSIPPLSLLRFSLNNSSVKVLLGNQLLYANGIQEYESGELVGSGYHYVLLPSSVKGKKLKIIVKVGENSASNPCTTFEILKPAYLFDYYSHHAISVGVGMFLVVLGILVIALGLIAMGFSKGFYRLILIGFLAFLLGTWTLCYMKVIQVFSMDLSFNTKLEYVSLLLMPIPIELLILNMRKGKIQKWKWKVLCSLLLFNIIYFVISTFLQLLNVVHYPITLPVFHAYVLISFLFIVISKTLYDSRAGLQEKVFSIAIVLFGVFGILDVLRYMLQRIYALENSIFNVTWLPVGSLIFIMLLVVSYLVYLYDIFMDKTEKEVLKQLVYRDSLTGLYNRAKCMQIFEVLDSGSSDYAIVSIDMNGLKFVNDSKGHIEGDKLLTCFADIFKEAFGGIGTTIRMGGDEFTAIVRAEHLSDLSQALDDLLLLEKEKSKILNYPLEVSFGYSTFVECSQSMFSNVKAIDVYKSADEKMYKMKNLTKKSRMN